jgi:AcrR family transcriptional regulator
MCPVSSDHGSGQLSGSGRASPRRADAARNRQRILGAARTALSAADDLDGVTMHSIAQDAGVGQGTLYRHFPTREDLVLAVYHTDVERLITAAAELSADHHPREAMRLWLTELAAYGRVKRGVSRVVLAAATRRAIADQWRPLVLDALQSLLDAGARTGELRDDVNAEDVWPLLGFLWQEPLPKRRAERLVAVVLDGLATQSGNATEGLSRGTRAGQRTVP